MDDFSYGIEEEFFLVGRETGEIPRRVPRSLVARCKAATDNHVSHELMQSQVETRTPLCQSSTQLHAVAGELRGEVAKIAQEYELGIIASGTLPLAEWRELVPTGKPRYQQLLDDFQIVSRRSLLCGLNVKVSIPPGNDRVDVMNRILPWVPVFLALSTSSPFWNRHDSGLLSYRQAAYDEWPRTGIPDFFAGEAEYNALTRALIRSDVIPDASHLRFAIRPAPNDVTLELRIADSCTRLDDAICIADLFRCLVRAAVRDPHLGRARTPMTRMLIEENRWQAKRYGKDAHFVDCLHGGERRPFGEWLNELHRLIDTDAAELGCNDSLARSAAISAQGTSANRQRATYRRARLAGASRNEACHEIVAELMAATV